MSSPGHRVVAVVASAGRKSIVNDVLTDLLAQTRRLDAVILSVPDEESVPDAGVPAGVTILTGARGSAAQRNAGLASETGADVAFFFDDDSRVREDYVEMTMEAFESDEKIIGTSGRVLLDGAAGAVAREIGVDDAVTALQDSRNQSHTAALTTRLTLHGCNFAVRVGRTDERFDERLPLYSWLEDHDLARRLLRIGRLVTVHDAVIVHRGVKSGGRESHVRYGYSQVMNPAYFVSKGSFPLSLAFTEIARPVGRNLLESLFGADRVWRRRRLRGNALAAFDVARRRFTPERILTL